MKENYTIGFLTSANPLDKKTWSGTYFNMYNALSNHFTKIEVLGPIPVTKYIRKTIRLLHYIHRIIFLKRYNNDHNIILSKYYANRFQKILKNKNIDLLFAPAASAEIALLKTNIPICYLSDSSFNQMRHYYDDYKSISILSCKESNYIEQKVIDKSSAVVYPSKWAADYVADFYKADKKKVHVVKFGSNFIDLPPIDIPELPPDKIELLFVGVDWHRKGGEIVYKTLELLIAEGYDVNLTVVGTIPPKKHPNMKAIKFLDKNNKEDAKKLSELFLSSTLLFVPTRAECFGIVFCEACSFGLPSITTNTGGVTSIIEDGYNGYTLPLDADAVKYTEKIKYLINNPDILKNFGHNAKVKYDSELNWTIWGNEMHKIFTDILEKA